MARGCWVEYRHGWQLPDTVLELESQARMTEDACLLTSKERVIVERPVAETCQHRGWTLHAVNAQPNHVHVVVTADRDPQEVRNQFKAWCSRKLSDAAGLTEKVAKGAGRRHWFSEGGDAEHIDSEGYLANCIAYVKNQ